MVQGVASASASLVLIDLAPAGGQHVRPDGDLAQNLPLLAIRGFGQNEVQMVPLRRGDGCRAPSPTAGR